MSALIAEQAFDARRRPETESRTDSSKGRGWPARLPLAMTFGVST